MLIGYARVSTDDQKLALQKDALEQAGCQQIHEDKLSGAKAERPGLAAALSHAREGDTLVVWRLDRLSRSLKDLIEMVSLLESRDIGLKSLHESIDTRSSSREVDLPHLCRFGRVRAQPNQRTHAGRTCGGTSKRQKRGRPKSLSADKQALAVKLYDEENHTVKQICQMMGISKPTLYKYINAVRAKSK
jgi:Site-specific recombinases, DNA invertase Pin homologs